MLLYLELFSLLKWDKMCKIIYIFSPCVTSDFPGCVFKITPLLFVPCLCGSP